ncbi:hypothetical protein SAMN03159496_05684 [Rhizobium sp. NFR07]|nr:hypothetical protein SAMN03159496_05684 [Rhizobium sp. NFR07]
MCNDYEQHIRYAEYCKMIQDLALGIPSHQTELDMPQADDIKIGDTAPVIRAADDGWYPATGKGGSVFNFRSEGRHFGDSHRCLIPASAFSSSPGRNTRRRSTGSRSMVLHSWR